MEEFSAPSLEEAFHLADEGVIVEGQRFRKVRDLTRLEFECRLKDPQSFCSSCGVASRSRGTRPRWLLHAPAGTGPVHLLLRLRCYECAGCGTYWSEQPTSLLPAGRDRGKLTKRGLLWALKAVSVDSQSIRSVAANLGLGWDATNKAVLDAGYEHLISDPTRFDGVKTLGVDEHCWRHTWHGERFVTVIMDLTPRQYGRPARLLDMVPGRSKKVFKTWLASQDTKFRLNVTTVAMDGFTGYKSAVREELKHATTVMDPFHVVQLIGEKLNLCRHRLQQETLGRRGRKGDILYQARKLLLTRVGLLKDKAWDKVTTIITNNTYDALTRIWNIYQSIIKCYENEDKRKGRNQFATIIDALNPQTIKGIPELRTMARTLKQRRDDILAFFTHPYSSNGPTEALNGRIEHLRGIALGFRNLDNYIRRSLIHTGGFKNTILNKL